MNPNRMSNQNQNPNPNQSPSQNPNPNQTTSPNPTPAPNQSLKPNPIQNSLRPPTLRSPSLAISSIRAAPSTPIFATPFSISAETTSKPSRVPRFPIPLSVFDPAATHFLISDPKRTEKFLGSVACGLWILKPEYIKACEQAGRWVEEAAFEWTAVDAKSKIDGPSIGKWRKQGGRAFEKAK